MVNAPNSKFVGWGFDFLKRHQNIEKVEITMNIQVSQKTETFTKHKEINRNVPEFLVNIGVATLPVSKDEFLKLEVGKYYTIRFEEVPATEDK